MARIVMTETRQRGFFGKVFKWLFIIFNVLMGIWLVAYWVTIGQMVSDLKSTAEQAGGTIGATIGTGALIIFWAAGAAIIGGLSFATRGKKITTQETVE